LGVSLNGVVDIDIRIVFADAFGADTAAEPGFGPAVNVARSWLSASGACRDTPARVHGACDMTIFFLTLC
ncbi:MAG TPA: hypothetical protein VMW06_11150, partial [Desulfobacterales bacterium]|nr:hypothetical protein [Desulfobacterales bacterium]